MSNIFVSYAREDRHRVEPIVKELERFGWTVFWDREISPGQNWRNEITKALNESHCVVVAWTFASVHPTEHHWVKEEAAMGEKRNILVPFRLDVVDPPLGFQEMQTADLSEWHNDCNHPNFVQCIEAIRAMIFQDSSAQKIQTGISISDKNYIKSDCNHVQSVTKIIEMFDNPATIFEAIHLAEKLPFKPYHRALFEQKKIKYIAGLTDYDRLNWIEEMKGLISFYSDSNSNKGSNRGRSYIDDTDNYWHHFDKKRLKDDFNELCRSESCIKVIFIERNDEALSAKIPKILFTIHCKSCAMHSNMKGDINDDRIRLANISNIKANWTDFTKKIFGITNNFDQIPEEFKKHGLHKQTHFVIQQIFDFNTENFNTYFQLWEQLNPEKPIFLFFFLENKSLPRDLQKNNYLCCYNDQHEHVEGIDLSAFTESYPQYKSNITLNETRQTITFKEAIDNLEFLG